MVELLQHSSFAFITIVSVLGLLVGSFLNVVIYRLPIMLEREWQAQCDELNGIENSNTTTFTLSHPRSACPHCKHAISAIENIDRKSVV